MRAWLLVCAALALAPWQPPAAAIAAHRPANYSTRLEHIKSHILAKLGLPRRPTPLRAPPRDVVRQILARAADPQPERHHEPEQSMREVIAIAHRDTPALTQAVNPRFYELLGSQKSHSQENADLGHEVVRVMTLDAKDRCYNSNSP